MLILIKPAMALWHSTNNKNRPVDRHCSTRTILCEHSRTPVIGNCSYRVPLMVPKLTFYFKTLKFATRAVCDSHGPWGVLATAGPASDTRAPVCSLPVEGQNKPHPFGGFAGSFKPPWTTQIATESPFNVENDGAYLRCEF